MVCNHCEHSEPERYSYYRCTVCPSQLPSLSPALSPPSPLPLPSLSPPSPLPSPSLSPPFFLSLTLFQDCPGQHHKSKIDYHLCAPCFLVYPPVHVGRFSKVDQP